MDTKQRRPEAAAASDSDSQAPSDAPLFSASTHDSLPHPSRSFLPSPSTPAALSSLPLVGNKRLFKIKGIIKSFHINVVSSRR